MAAAVAQALFDRIPPDFFGPLAGEYASLYWSVLERLHRFEFEGEQRFLVKGVALEIAEETIAATELWRSRRNSPSGDLAGEPGLFSPEDGEATDEQGLLRASARRVIARLERTKWFYFEYRSTVGQVLSFFPAAARILEALVRVARDEQPVFQGYAHAIASVLKPDAFAARPGLSLREARRNTQEMVRELKILERNIHSFTQRILDQATAAAVLEQGLDRYRDAVMANYHRLKTAENLFKWRDAILARLDVIERDDASLEAAARWNAEQLARDLSTGADLVAEEIRVMRGQFEALPQLVLDIDARNARFSGAALRKLMYLLRQDRRTEGQLQFLVDALAHDAVPELAFDVYKNELLDDGFLYTIPTRRAKPSPQPLVRNPRADGEAIRREASARVRRAFARRRIEEFVDSVLAGRSQASFEEIPVEDDSSYVRLLYLLAYGFDGASSFGVRIDPSRENRLRLGPYGLPAGRIERKRRR